MPLFKNLENEICQVYEPEVKKLLEEGWKELTKVEEDLYREALALDHSLTSSVSIEAARVKAGVEKALHSKTQPEGTKVSKKASDAKPAVKKSSAKVVSNAK